MAHKKTTIVTSHFSFFLRALRQVMTTARIAMTALTAMLQPHISPHWLRFYHANFFLSTIVVA
jgi:hypothetical protein